MSGCAAIVHDGKSLAQQRWDASGRRSQALFDAVESLLTETGVSLGQIDRFVVGLGPGNYSGLRTSLAAVRGFAQPHGTAVWGVPSAAAVAKAVTPTATTTCVAVIGDARRERVWLGEYQRELSEARDTTFSLVPLAELSARLQPGSMVASSDWDRLADRLENLELADVTLLRQPCLPEAALLAELVDTCGTKASSSADFLEPIYLHPPVFIEPRFTEATKRSLPPQA